MKSLLLLRVCIVAGLVLVIAGVSQVRMSPPLPAPPRVAAPPQELLIEDPIDGEPVAEDRAGRLPLAVIIENFPDARPQWGLSLTSRVYEAITEGGITRYLAIFGPNDADRVGPVRSARTQFLDYVLELGAALAHAGGNEDALASIRTFHIRDLDEFRYAEAYRRITKPRLATEHTMFASTGALRALIDRAGWEEKISIDHPVWKAEMPPGLRPANQRVAIDFSFPEYRVQWLYRPGANDYERFVAGAPDTDAATGAAVTAKSIVIAVIPRVPGRTLIREETWTFSDLGSGRAWVIQDGAVTEGRWQKASRNDRLRCLDAAGREIGLNRGRQWIEIIPPEVTPEFESAIAIQ
jgi:Protein of unknown function (DUF3048) N-terminal domain/Protein of unknown function (DUF3048) C-terminal domain